MLKSKRAQYLIVSTALLVMSVGTLMAVPTSAREDPSIKLPSSARNASSAFRVVTPSGAVPSNVMYALFVPKNSNLVGWHNYDRGNGPYDRSITIFMRATPKQEYAFFKAALQQQGWKILENHSTNKASEILGSIGGSDGRYWEIGIRQSSPESPLRDNTSSKTLDSGITIELRLLQMQPS